MIRLAVFLLATAGLVWISRRSLRSPSSHGFHRFWAWEAIVALVLLVLPDWFGDPRLPTQIVSWALLAASLGVLIPGVRALRKRGEAGGGDAEKARSSLYAFEKTTALVTTGVFRFVRHPMYASLLYLAWGAFFKHPSLAGGALVAVATVFLDLTARSEEAEDVAYFGDAYRDYMRVTRRFVPLVY